MEAERDMDNEAESLGVGVKLVFQISHRSLELVSTAEGGDDFHGRADLRERDDLERIRGFDGFDALVGVFVEQASITERAFSP